MMDTVADMSLAVGIVRMFPNAVIKIYHGAILWTKRLL